MIRLALVDDDALVRAGLTMILGGERDIEVVGEAGDGRAGLELVRAQRPDVVLMDIRMPVLDGLSATRQLLGDPDPPAVVVLTTFDTDDLVLEALRAGARGFLLKSTHPHRLIEAVRAVAAGEPMLSPSVTAQLISSVTTGAPREGSQERATLALAKLAPLTEREREVAVALGQGSSNADIAAQLYMSVPTVKAHVSRVMAKLGVENRTQVALVVHDAGLSDHPGGPSA